MRHIVNAHWMGYEFCKTCTHHNLNATLNEARTWFAWAANESGVPTPANVDDMIEVRN
ncbi:hypothetical protein [Aeromonas veronii]|uniref:hypothetical protein n=1 Tax=Aeromonas veronii TaxID=654 RepID=UPI001456277E|nr:hypothetical protein [Aeromonas veronii]